MLNDKSRHGLRHLPARRKWPAFTAGTILRLPQTEVRGGWGAGWYDWLPWRLLSFDLRGETATIQSLTDGTIKPIQRRHLEMFEEIAPFGTMLRLRPLPEAARLQRNRKSKPRYA